MATIITWQILTMRSYPQYEGQTDVVVSADWSCNGVDSTDSMYASSIYNTATFILNPEQPFTPYEDLTQEQVLGWVWASGVDKDATEAVVQTRIDNLMSPPIVQLALPWSQ